MHSGGEQEQGLSAATHDGAAQVSSALEGAVEEQTTSAFDMADVA